MDDNDQFNASHPLRRSSRIAAIEAQRQRVEQEDHEQSVDSIGSQVGYIERLHVETNQAREALDLLRRNSGRRSANQRQQILDAEELLKKRKEIAERTEEELLSRASLLSPLIFQEISRLRNAFDIAKESVCQLRRGKGRPSVAKKKQQLAAEQLAKDAQRMFLISLRQLDQVKYFVLGIFLFYFYCLFSINS